jgi:GNAT superfamily N-acetyltransferase
MTDACDRTVAAQCEWIEGEAWASMEAAMAPSDRQTLGVTVERMGAVVALRSPRCDSPIVNRVFGLGLEHPLSEAELDAIVVDYRQAHVPRWLARWAPAARPRDFTQLAAARDARVVSPSARWWRPLTKPAAVDPGVTITPVAAAERDIFGRTVIAATGIPPECQPLVSAFVGHEAWRAYLVWDHGQPIAAGALFLRNSVAWLGLGGTLPAWRGRGAQRALIRRRLRDAATLGCLWATAETSQHTAERPDPSYRNMQREGFQLTFLRETYLFTSPTL